VETNRELILEDARSISEGLWCIARYVQEAAESLDSRIEDGTLDGLTEAEELRETLETIRRSGSERRGGFLVESE
jgi:hypothetical protein